MKVARLETLYCDAGWRPWIFLKATTDDGAVGWAEITDSHGSPRGLAGIIEFVGGILIALGLFTSPIAFIASGEMAVAYFQQHAPHGFWPIQNGGELPVLYCFIFLYFVAVGSGKLSIDSVR